MNIYLKTYVSKKHLSKRPADRPKCGKVGRRDIGSGGCRWRFSLESLLQAPDWESFSSRCDYMWGIESGIKGYTSVQTQDEETKVPKW